MQFRGKASKINQIFNMTKTVILNELLFNCLIPLEQVETHNLRFCHNSLFLHISKLALKINVKSNLKS